MSIMLPLYIVAAISDLVRRDWVRLPRGAIPVARASPRDWPRASGGASLGQWGWRSANAGMKAKCMPIAIHRAIGVSHTAHGWSIFYSYNIYEA